MVLEYAFRALKAKDRIRKQKGTEQKRVQTENERILRQSRVERARTGYIGIPEGGSAFFDRDEVRKWNKSDRWRRKWDVRKRKWKTSCN
ncbi:MAG: hypothetical protein NWE87_06920 [Candidatus Bathyarchaeota archaeon]|nr:hypothetical protein [Candidatus Bathyarchaeota archaeon]